MDERKSENAYKIPRTMAPSRENCGTGGASRGLSDLISSTARQQQPSPHLGSSITVVYCKINHEHAERQYTLSG